MTIVCRTHKRGEEILVAACDEAILGETFKEGKTRIEIREEFYRGEPVDGDDLEARLARATIANLTGEETVQAAIDLGYVDEANVLWIDGTPHAQFVLMS